MNIAILGSGLAGAFAYRACKDMGITPVIFSNAPLGAIPAGAVWLHSLPESIPGAPFSIINTSIGTKQGYLWKQWGKKQGKDWKSSFPSRDRLELGYDMNIYLPKIWEGANESFVLGDIDIDKFNAICSEFDLVIQTYPRKEDIDKRKEYLVHIPIATALTANSSRNLFPNYDADVVVVYSGSVIHSWVRKTYFTDRICVEYPTSIKLMPSIEYGLSFQVSRYPDLHPDTPKLEETKIKNVLLVGRLATWNRKYLSDQAYHDVIGVICNA